MSEPQFQIRERAGLEESKLNQDFIEFLRKWSSPILIVAVAIFGGYALYQRYERSQATKVDSAFADYTALLASGSPSPVSLLEIADTYKSVKGIGPMAQLSAADAYMAAVRARRSLGASVNPDGSLASTDGVLTPVLKEEYLGKAREIYKTVLSATSKVPEKRIMALSATFGLAAIAESEGNFSDATALYEQAATLAESQGDKAHAKIARDRITGLDKLKTITEPLSAADLPKPPPPPVLPAIPAGPAGPAPITTPEGTPAATPGATPTTPPSPAPDGTPIPSTPNVNPPIPAPPAAEPPAPATPPK